LILFLPTVEVIYDSYKGILVLSTARLLRSSWFSLVRADSNGFRGAGYCDIHNKYEMITFSRYIAVETPF